MRYAPPSETQHVTNMALTNAHTYLLLRLRGMCPDVKAWRSLVDVGEQNWTGSASFSDCIKYARGFGVPLSDTDEQAVLRYDAPEFATLLFEKKNVFYAQFLGVAEYAAIDLHGTEIAWKLNLNLPHDPDVQFDVVFNLGTTEHVFNQFEAFNTIHKLCRDGGMMVHVLPASGGREHGFFNYHATFFFDLAAANGYEMVDFTWTGFKQKNGATVQVFHHVKDRTEYLEFIDQAPLGVEGFFVCFRKASRAPFACPHQAIYGPEDDSREAMALKSFWKRNP